MTLGREFPWAVAVGAALLGAAAAFTLWGRHTRGRRLLAGAYTLSAVGVLVWALVRRPPRWLLPDDMFFAGPSWALGEYGVNQNPFLIDEPLRYHWFSYGWLGTFADLPGLDLYGDLQSFGRFVIAVFLVFSARALLDALGVKGVAGLAAIVTLTLFDTPPWTTRGRGLHFNWTESFSQTASLPLLVTLICVGLRTGTTRHRDGRHAALLLTLLAFTIATKTSTGIVAAAALAGIVWFRWKGVARLMGTVAAAVMTVAGTWLFGSSSSVSLPSLLTRPDWPLTVFGDFTALYHGPLWQWLLVLSLLLATLGLPVIAVLWTEVRYRGNQLSWLAPMALAAGGLALVGPGDDLNIYALQAAVATASIVLIARVACSWVDEPRRLATSACVLGVIGLLVRRFDLDLTSGTQIRWWTISRPLLLVLALLGASSALSRVRGLRPARGSAAALAMTVVMIGVIPDSPFPSFSSEDDRWRNTNSQLSDVRRIELRDFLLTQTPPDSVLVQTARLETADARRRQLFAIGGGGQFLPRRNQLLGDLLAVSRTGDCPGLGPFVARGATHLVAPSDATGRLDACAARVYENASYVVYDLTNAP
jgi:hypothetical protein